VRIDSFQEYRRIVIEHAEVDAAIKEFEQRQEGRIPASAPSAASAPTQLEMTVRPKKPSGRKVDRLSTEKTEAYLKRQFADSSIVEVTTDDYEKEFPGLSYGAMCWRLRQFGMRGFVGDVRIAWSTRPRPARLIRVQAV
jgi:hypothetical protein